MSVINIKLNTFTSPEGFEASQNAIHEATTINTRITFEDMTIAEHQLKAFLECLPAVDRRKIKLAVNCYNTWEIWLGKSAARRFYNDCAKNSEGSERDRYLSILWAMDDKQFFCYDG